MARKKSDGSWLARLFGSRGIRGGSAKRPRNTANVNATTASAKRRREAGLRVFFDTAVAKAGGQSSAEQKRLAKQILLLVPNARTRYRTFLMSLEKINREKKRANLERAERIIIREFRREEKFFRENGFFELRTLNEVIKSYFDDVVEQIIKHTQANLDQDEYIPIIERLAVERLPKFLGTLPGLAADA